MFTHTYYSLSIAVLRTSMSYSTSMRNAEGASMSATHTTPLHSTTTSDPWALATQQGWVLYERGQPSVQCTVVLQVNVCVCVCVHIAGCIIYHTQPTVPTHCSYTQTTAPTQGKVLVKSGKEGFQLELGPWNVLGQGALERVGESEGVGVMDVCCTSCPTKHTMSHINTHTPTHSHTLIHTPTPSRSQHSQGQIGPYIADFDAVPVAPCRLLRIHRSAYMTAGDSVRHHALTHSASATGYLCGGETGTFFVVDR